MTQARSSWLVKRPSNSEPNTDLDKVEYEIDKKLGMSGLEAVEKLGIAQYNAECRAIVMRFSEEWRQVSYPTAIHYRKLTLGRQSRDLVVGSTLTMITRYGCSQQ